MIYYERRSESFENEELNEVRSLWKFLVTNNFIKLVMILWMLLKVDFDWIRQNVIFTDDKSENFAEK